MQQAVAVTPTPGDAAQRRWTIAVAAACLVAAVGGGVAELVVGAATPPGPLGWAPWSSSVPGVVLAAAAAVLALRLPRHPMTRLLLAGGVLCTLNGVAAAYATLSMTSFGGGLPLTTAAAHVGGRLGPVLNLIPPLVLLLFPDARLPSPRWRPVAALSIAATAFAALVLVAVPWRVLGVDDPRFPDLVTVPLPDGVWAGAVAVTPWIIATSPVIPLLVFVRRFHGADRVRRAQLRWMLLAALLNVVLMVVPLLAGGLVVDVAFVVSMMAVAAAVVIAVTRHRLYDVDVVLGATLVYGGLATVVVIIDLALFVGVSAIVDEPVAAVAAAGVVAVLYGPLRARMQRWVDRILTGGSDPYAVVSALGRRLEEVVEPAELLHEVARTVSTAFRSPYARVELDRADGATVVAEHGYVPGPEELVVLPFAYRETVIGRLALAAPSIPAAAASRQLLADVVRQAAAAVRATSLADELQLSRERLVTGVAEERRRLRRDLHDGLGPTLAAAALKIEAARNLTEHDPGAARSVLDEVRDDLGAVLGDVRRLVHDLRPPALDQWGLAGAVRRQAERFDGRPAVTVHTDGDLDALPAAVEVAAYRIASEALANAVRHAAATRIEVTLRSGSDGLEIEVVDDGAGIAAGPSAGIGLVAMRERSAELGGSCTVGPAPGGGTRVHALLPVRASVLVGAR